MHALLDFLQQVLFIGGKPDAALYTAIYTARRKQRPVAQEGELEGCRTPQASTPVLCRSGTRTWAGSTAPDSLPIPPTSLSHPSPQLSARASCWCQLYQGEAAAVCKLLSPCLCLPRAREGFTLSPSLCSEEAKSKSRHFEGKIC